MPDALPTSATEEIESRRQEVIAQHGEWTAHNIELAQGVFTRDAGEPTGCGALVPLIEDFAKKPIAEMRILDLACLEGLYAIELARLGAEVVGIEGRLQNVEKARFAKDVLGLDRLELIQDDVRNLGVERHGHFDVVLCFGILYHLDVPDVFRFMRSMAEVCTGVTVVNTHVCPPDLTVPPWGEYAPRHHPAVTWLRGLFLSALGRTPVWERLQTFEFEGVRYEGRRVPEHPPDMAQKERLKDVWASLDNPYSIWLTRDSLREALLNAGFRNAYHSLSYWNRPDRITVVATTER